MRMFLVSDGHKRGEQQRAECAAPGEQEQSGGAHPQIPAAATRDQPRSCQLWGPHCTGTVHLLGPHIEDMMGL